VLLAEQTLRSARSPTRRCAAALATIDSLHCFNYCYCYCANSVVLYVASTKCCYLMLVLMLL
jgi:hypothetical protein